MSGADTRFGARRSGVLLLAVTATLTTLAACRRVDDETARMLSEPGERHAIGYSKGQALLHVEAGPTQGGLSDNQRGDVLGFLQRYREQGTGPLHVSLPTTARGHMIAQGASREIRGLARQVGVAPDQVVVARHGVAGAEPPAVIVSFFRPVAVPPVCGDWSADLGRDHERVG